MTGQMEPGTYHKPLEGLFVLDFTHFIAGPLCTRLLADLGARVVKVERPYTGLGRATSDAVADNVGKESICVDLNSKDGQAVIYRLVPHADVVVENFRPGVMTRLGLDFEALHEINPKLVMASVSGFGQKGAMSPRAAFGATAHAEAGFLWLQQVARGGDEAPFAPGIQVADIMTALFTLSAILAALNQRSVSGIGQHVDVSLMDSQLFMLAGPIADILSTSQPDAWQPFRHPIHRSRDGRYFTINIASEHNWDRLAIALGHPEFHGPVPKNGNELIAEWVSAMEAEAIVAQLDRVGAPYGLVRTLVEAAEQPYVQEKGMLVPVTAAEGSPVPIVRNPFFFSAADTTPGATVPMAGQNTRPVLREVGFDSAEITELEHRGVIRSLDPDENRDSNNYSRANS